MLAVVLISGTGLAVALAGADRLLAAVVGRGAGRRLAAVLGNGSGAEVRITSAPFLTQLAAGVYREIEVTAGAFTVGGLEFRGLSARLSQVHAPVRRLLGRRGLVAGQVTAIMTSAAVAAARPSRGAARDVLPRPLGSRGRIRARRSQPGGICGRAPWPAA